MGKPRKVPIAIADAFAENFKTPTLVIHGELDYRVPYYEGLEYYNTLRAKASPHASSCIPTRTTGFSNRKIHGFGIASFLRG